MRHTTSMAAPSATPMTPEQPSNSDTAVARHPEQCGSAAAAPCCGCTTRCEIQRCSCINSAKVCTRCVPRGSNKCENINEGQYTHGKRVSRVPSTSGQQTHAAAAGSSAASSSQAPQSHSWQKSPAKVKKNSAMAKTGASSSAAAAADALDGVGEQPACIHGVRQYCAAMRDRAAAAGYSINAEQLHLIEQLVAESQRLYNISRDLHKKFSASNLESAIAQAALAANNKKFEKITAKFNEADAKLKTLRATASNLKAAVTATSSPSKKRQHIEREDERERPQSAGGSATSAHHVSSEDDSRRRRIEAHVHPARHQHNSATLGQPVFDNKSAPAPRPVFFRRTGPVDSPVSNMERSASGKIRYPGARCLVASGLQLRSHVSTVDALHCIKQTLFNLDLCREDDGGTSTPVDAFKLAKDSWQSAIRWKVVFSSADAAAMVLERSIRSGQRDILLRGFENRGELQQSEVRARAELEWAAEQPRPPVRHGSNATEMLVRTPSSDSVMIVEPPVKREEKPVPPPMQPQPPAPRLQFSTRHAAQQVQQVAAPEPVAQPATPTQALQVAPPPPPGVTGAYPHGWVAYPSPPRPLVPMMHPYHNAPPPHGMYVQHPGGMYHHGAPMGYAPAGFMPAPMAYPSYPPQF